MGADEVEGRPGELEPVQEAQFPGDWESAGDSVVVSAFEHTSTRSMVSIKSSFQCELGDNRASVLTITH